MDLTLNAEQEAFLTATAEWCRDNMPLEQARVRPAGLWQQLQAMGWTGMTAPDMGLNHATEAAVFAELGRHLAPIGLIATAVGNRWFEDGWDYKLALALPASEGDDLRVLDPVDSGGVLMWQDHEIRVFDLPDSFTNIVTKERHITEHRPSLDLSTDQSRQEWTTTAVWTDNPAASLHLQLLSAAFAVGCADAARDMAADYAKLREQFNRPIGWFQALKHLCSDTAVRCAVARSQLYYAACALDADDPEAAFHIASAKHLADQAALENARTNVQVHGGIGMTDEAYPHLCLKRAHLLAFVAPARREIILGEAA
jgi:alkylation response protein AidB-like acyl-CoA dehydrogenase